MASQYPHKVTKSKKAHSKKPKLATIAEDMASSYLYSAAIPHSTPKLDLDGVTCVLILGLS